MIREKLIFKLPQPQGDLTCSDVDGAAFISAHESATGLSMGETQKRAICSLVGNLKGVGTTNGSNLWSLLTTKGSYLFPLCPSSDSVASSAGFGIELLSATSIGTFNNFVAGDFTPSGIAGGSTKYFDLGIRPIAWSQNNVGHAFYVLSNTGGTSIPLGTNDGAVKFTILRVGVSPNNMATRINANSYGSFNAVPSLVGLYHFQRPNSTQISDFFNGSFLATSSSPSITAANTNMYAMSRNNNGTPANNITGTSGGWAFNLPVMTLNEAADFYESLSNYQSNVITGGR